MEINSVLNNVRPRQVLLVGLGGIGSRTVDSVLEMMPDEYKAYTKAIAVDTDLEDLSSRLKNIPAENRIALGSNPENGQSVTIGEYIRSNPETMDWFVKGGHLETIKRRNTAQGAKQIRMVSRIALAATNEFCGMKKVLEDILQDMNQADGTTLSRGLLVMIVCSIAGGTGAGTVLQFPLYLEQALAKNFSDEDIQIECSMLLPNMFSRAQDMENQSAARANAYAVIRELMSLNSGRLKRKDILPECDFGEKEDRIAPYGRVLLFDDVSMSGDSIEQDLDKVYVPKTAKALNEYLFGPANGKITSALDNTLARVYRTDGAAIFSSVGSAKLEFPRAAYVQYVTGQWITKVIAETWTYPDRKVNDIYANLFREAVQSDTQRPTEKDKYKIFRDVIKEDNTPFCREIKQKYFEKNEVDEVVPLAEEFWEKCCTHLRGKLDADEGIRRARGNITDAIADKASANEFGQSLSELADAIESFVSYGFQYEMEVMRPIEAEDVLFYSKDKDESHLFTFIKAKQLHPLMIRYFLYDLYDRAYEASLSGQVPLMDTSKITGQKLSKKELGNKANQMQNEACNIGKQKLIANFAMRLIQDIKEYIKEIEDMFKCLELVVDHFAESSDRSISSLVKSNPKTGSVLAGGPLSMMYTWKKVEHQISEGEDAYTIDPDLNIKLHEIVYQGFMEQVNGKEMNLAPDGKPIRIRTKYERIVARELQIYYAKLLKDSYSMCFPENVKEAALLECGLENQYKENRSRAEDPNRYTVEYFISHGGRPLNITGDGDDMHEGITDAQYLEALLAAAVANSKPYCGRVDDNDGEKGIVSRLIVASDRTCAKIVDIDNVNSLGVAGERLVEDEFIPGVSASRVGQENVQTKFVSSGVSVDEFVFVTTLAGLQPFNFVAFLPSDDDEHAPTKAKTYYSAYREHIESAALRDDYITPHLHRDWHLADRLEDVTDKHTNTYNKEAAEAFAYGFIFDTIVIGRDGVVRIGKLNDPFFKDLDESGEKEFRFFDESIHAGIEEKKGEAKREVFNSILVKIFELLATTHYVRDAISAHAKNELNTFAINKDSAFIRRCLDDELLSDVTYNCILNVFDGYFQGSKRMQYNERDRAKKNTGYMFTLILEEILSMCKLFSDEASIIKSLYEQMVDRLYDDAAWDDSDLEKTGMSAQAEENTDEIQKLIMLAVKGEMLGGQNLFADRQPYSRANAKGMIDYFLNK